MQQPECIFDVLDFKEVELRCYLVQDLVAKKSTTPKIFQHKMIEAVTMIRTDYVAHRVNTCGNA